MMSDKQQLPAADDAERSSVKMASSHPSLMFVTLPNSQSYRWSAIENSLRSASIANCDDLLAVMRQYRSSMPDLVTFREYVKQIDQPERKKLFDRVLPQMIKLVLDLPTLFPEPIPRLTAQREMSVTMSQKQVACLLACGFFCLFGSDGGANAAAGSDRSKKDRFINFYGVFKQSAKVKRRKAKVEKLACFMRYFDRVTDSMPTGLVTFNRRVMTSVPNWSACDAPLSRLHVASNGFIEDAVGMLQVDFANKFVGGGVLSDGCVQEEIRFAICPELIVARLLADAMENNECVAVIGCERFCAYDGYGDDFKFISNYVDVTPFRRIRTANDRSRGNRRHSVSWIPQSVHQEQRRTRAEQSVLRLSRTSFAGRNRCRSRRCHW
jgi:poly(ADP-ribose) glycohydrolase